MRVCLSISLDYRRLRIHVHDYEYVPGFILHSTVLVLCLGTVRSDISVGPVYLGNIQRIICNNIM